LLLVAVGAGTLGDGAGGSRRSRTRTGGPGGGRARRQGKTVGQHWSKTSGRMARRRLEGGRDVWEKKTKGTKPPKGGNLVVDLHLASYFIGYIV
jgi:hypothetical protein